MNFRPVSLFALSLCCFLTTSAGAASTDVVATGTCPVDPSNVQAAIFAAGPGDTVRLLPGPSGEPFDLTCAGGILFPFRPPLTLAGVPGRTEFRGSGGSEAALVVLGSNLAVTGVLFRNFNVAIVIAPPGPWPTPTGISIDSCSFEQNTVGVAGLAPVSGFSLTGNTVKVPAPSPGVKSTGGFLFLAGYDDLVMAHNTFTGPGSSGALHSLDQLVPTLGLTTFGALQTEAPVQVQGLRPAPAGERARISHNTFRGLGLCLGSSSNNAQVTRNSATDCDVGIRSGNDSRDGHSKMTSSLIALNQVSKSSVGAWLHDAEGNYLLVNSFEGDHLAGLAVSADAAAMAGDNAILENDGSIRVLSQPGGARGEEREDPVATIVKNVHAAR